VKSLEQKVFKYHTNVVVIFYFYFWKWSCIIL